MWSIVGILFLGIGLFLAAVALYDSNRFVTVSYRFSDRRIRKKTRLILLSDLHDKRYGKNNKKLLQAILSQQPDLIVCAGDMLTATPDRPARNAQELLVRLAKRYPVYFANGNHESRMLLEPETYGDAGRKFVQSLDQAGVVRLENQNVFLPASGIRLYGLDLPRRVYRKLKQEPFFADQVRELLGEAVKDEYVILLAHHPAYFETYGNWGADLTLSGHLHGGIMRLPFVGGVLSTAFTLFPKYDGGLFEKEGRRMVVSRGLGSHTIPLRFFNPAELVVIDLVPKDEE